MAIDFSLLPAEVPVPQKAPSPFAWSIAFVVLTLAGIAFALWSWPHSAKTKTQTLWFWFRIVVIPVCLAGALVLRRFSYFYKCRNRALSDNGLSKAYLDLVFDAASVPLAVLAAGYRLHIDEKENTFDAIVARSASRPTRPAKDTREMIVASCLEPAVAALTFDDEERQGAVLEWILHSFAPAIADALSTASDLVPVEVHLDIDSSVLPHEAIQAIWAGLPASVRPSRLNVQPVIGPCGGLWLVDTMLDRKSPALRDVVTLLISANFSPLRSGDPEAGSAEAATMMLLCPAGLARKERLPVAGWLHRPQADTPAPPEDALHYALRWGRTMGTAVGGTIQTGFDERTAAQLPVALRAAGRSGDEASSSDFALDTLAGNTGPTAPWLAAVLALDRAIASNAPYIAGVQSEARVLLAVLAPPGHHMQQEGMKND
ncbi:hypothetical protein OR16_41511 [Cupriavidus basilensis OR16]|uniref:Transmembrane protein n=1 Tax=Cupriavidus basilensis OR16 TaxID=1127483 RepID=H1SIH8_9BURK|nr:hypothetical protein [Cupriavidus basilensis]EHP37670.1 hypothetical protein OR16_41511 [Cupriavidus basilensis OR16]